MRKKSGPKMEPRGTAVESYTLNFVYKPILPHFMGYNQKTYRFHKLLSEIYIHKGLNV